MASKQKKQAKWAEAKSRCRLDEEDIRMAKELGIGPRSLIKNIASPQQQWKASVKDWLRGLYEKKFGHRRPEPPSAKPSQPPSSQAPPPPPPASDSAAFFHAVPFWGLGDPDFEGDDFDDDEDSDVPGFESPKHAPADPSTPIDDTTPLPKARDIAEDRRQPMGRRAAAEDKLLLARQRDFRRVAELVSAQISELPWVQSIVLFGSLALPLKRELPRFSEFRRAGVKLLHEVTDIDLAVWVTDLSQLNTLRKTISRVINDLNQLGANPGVAHHHFDVHIFEPMTDRYRGRRCSFGQCPKPHKNECYVPGCGASPFLRQIGNYKFDRGALGSDRSVPLFTRDSSSTEDQGEIDIPF